jgi:hypothetical protein
MRAMASIGAFGILLVLVVLGLWAVIPNRLTPPNPQYPTLSPPAVTTRALTNSSGHVPSITTVAQMTPSSVIVP